MSLIPLPSKGRGLFGPEPDLPKAVGPLFSHVHASMFPADRRLPPPLYMPQPRKPSNVLKMSGAFDKNPDRGRARANEPVPAGELGGPPKHLSPAAKKIWLELAKQLPAGVAADCDRLSFELIVTLMSRFRDGSIRGFELTAMNSLLSRFGLTPADRSRISVTPAKPSDHDEWSDLLPSASEGSG
jgi:phage terminase small subunit